MIHKMKLLTRNFWIFSKTIVLLWKTSSSTFLLILFLDTISGLIIPGKLWVWKEFLDSVSEILVTPSNSFKNMLFWLAMHFLLILLGSVLSKVSNFIQNVFSSNLNKVITEKILNKTMGLDMKDFDDSETYNLIQKSSEQSLNRSLSILQTTVNFINNITTFFGVIGILIFLNTSIVLLCLVSSVPMFYISMRILNKWFDVFNERFEKNRFVKHLKTIFTTNQNIKEIKIYRSDQYLAKVILGILEKYIQEDKKIRKRFLIETSIIEVIDNFIMYSIKILVVIICVKKRLTIGTLTMYVTAIDNLKNSVSNILSLISVAYENCLYMSSIFQLLDIPVENQENKRDFPVSFQKIEFRQVSFCYPGSNRYALKNINVVLKANHTYALVGLNGSGKTTFIKLLLNLYSPTEGEILVDGININEFNRLTLFQNVAAVFQDFIQYPFDIKTNIGLGNLEEVNNLSRITAAARCSGADDFIVRLPEQYDTMLKKEWSGSVDLSLGQWQKLAITRALMKPSSILILDEPTASLDVIAEHETFIKFQEMKSSKLCILVTHRFVNTRQVDNIIVMDSGQIIEFGAHTELLGKGGVYARLYHMQANSYEVSV
ncbi:ABC transporter ATP-binding protein [Paenibacillus macerans]|uniref:ABC transporter ATP-binding protein n=1 Tax=Paenibacillus macerans TaxID=44252 RepID=UPI00203A4393|nr:ABC transporter ATP-binding protein [Paenibacillus macerans]MCM3702175.1 ABC transporter ATP-binding protein/permease [Paenibacillus macerans]